MGKLELKVIEKLRMGTPPERGAELYSVGYGALVEGVERHHLSALEGFGKIRFVCGSYGSGKTHFFRLLREAAFRNGSFISNVELGANEAPLNKFEKVFYAIIRNIATAEQFESEALDDAMPFGFVVRRALRTLGGLPSSSEDAITFGVVEKAGAALMLNRAIDIDFKKMILEYWKTYVGDNPDPAASEQRREEVLQWFAGEGSIGQYRTRFGVSKMISRENAKLMLRSLSAFIRQAGAKGLTILFDEAQQSYSAMRRSSLRDAHINLRSLIDEIEHLPGMFLVYATTPDFYSDPNYGIVVYGALSTRIGQPKDHAPKATDIVWNLDVIVNEDKDFVEAAAKIRKVYEKAYDADNARLPSMDAIVKFVREIRSKQGRFSRVSFWRILVECVVLHLDVCREGGKPNPTEIYEDVIDRLRDE